MLYSASRGHMACKSSSASLLNSPPSSQNSVQTAFSRRPRPPSYSLLIWVSAFPQRLPGLLCRLPAIPLSFIPASARGVWQPPPTCNPCRGTIGERLLGQLLTQRTSRGECGGPSAWLDRPAGGNGTNSPCPPHYTTSPACE